MIAQLGADNEWMKQNQASPSTLPHALSMPPVVSSSSACGAERLVFFPRDRKCPIFYRGRTGIGLSEWVEEVQAFKRARHLSQSDQAFFLFDHLQVEARE